METVCWLWRVWNLDFGFTANRLFVYMSKCSSLMFLGNVTMIDSPLFIHTHSLLYMSRHFLFLLSHKCGFSLILLLTVPVLITFVSVVLASALSPFFSVVSSLVFNSWKTRRVCLEWLGCAEVSLSCVLTQLSNSFLLSRKYDPRHWSAWSITILKNQFPVLLFLLKVLYGLDNMLIFLSFIHYILLLCECRAILAPCLLLVLLLPLILTCLTGWKNSAFCILCTSFTPCLFF